MLMLTVLTRLWPILLKGVFGKILYVCIMSLIKLNDLVNGDPVICFKESQVQTLPYLKQRPYNITSCFKFHNEEGLMRRWMEQQLSDTNYFLYVLISAGLSVKQREINTN